MFDVSAITGNFHLLLEGAEVTVLLSLMCYLFGAALGGLLCFGQMQSLYSVRWLARSFIDFFRTIPDLVPIMWIYACSPFILNVRVDPVPAASVAISFVAAANFAEIFRGGIAAIAHGQRDAALALGLNRIQLFAKVFFPQMLPIIIAPSLNLFSDIVKISSLSSLIGVAELTYNTAIASGTSYRHLELYTAAGAFYVAIIVTVSTVATWLGRRLHWANPTIGRR